TNQTIINLLGGTMRRLTTFFSDLKNVLTGRTGTGPIESNQPPYFEVSLFKLTVMSICTFGLYELYWFYKNGNFIKQRERTDILPFWRAFFAYFFCYQCFSRIRVSAAALGLPQLISAGPLAAGWIITTLLWRLPDPYWIISWFAFLSYCRRRCS